MSELDKALIEEVGMPQEIFEIFNAMPTEVLLEKEGATDLKNFANLNDWIAALLLIGVRHAMPDLNNEQAISLVEFLARRIPLPGFKHRWAWVQNQIERVGLKTMIQRVKIELDRSIQRDK